MTEYRVGGPGMTGYGCSRIIAAAYHRWVGMTRSLSIFAPSSHTSYPHLHIPTYKQGWVGIMGEDSGNSRAFDSNSVI